LLFAGFIRCLQALFDVSSNVERSVQIHLWAGPPVVIHHPSFALKYVTKSSRREAGKISEGKGLIALNLAILFIQKRSGMARQLISKVDRRIVWICE